ncbi:MAG: hypothetical protein K6G87_04435 [Butyrivibrio sp.]|uniref:hypothetical protein n=1 Tax=Butyrivibrio sp. TaxID=28121 RepID=UPI0025D757BE|nr:hypothetical protein [Butyrivibrio sp.]MCR5770466.1 hypothetical protein [Butyrivibrio sp.]
MNNSSISRPKKAMAGIIGMLMIIAMLFSAFYISYEAHHDCTGEDCPICAQIQMCENTLHKIGGGLAFLVAVIVPVIFTFVCASVFNFILLQETPISQKVRMND